LELATQQPFDAILMDLHMNGMDGFAAARAIRAHPVGHDVPIIALSAAALQRDVAASQAAGMNAHLPKPINALQLARALVQWIAPRSADAPATLPAPGVADGPAAPSTSAASATAAGPAPAARVAAPFQLPGLDVVRAVAALDHDWGRLRRVLLSFYRDCAPLPAALDAALQQRHWAE
ncbi:response regulator, partial [Macromonas bipunctata]|uniref:response regulator n=1 Tax=Macromonas bipunctata TaxID=183670 RepID=UPI0014749748